VRLLPTIPASAPGWLRCCSGQPRYSRASPLGEPKDCQFQIEAERMWHDADIDLQAGDRVHVYGSMIACGGPARGEKWTPSPFGTAGTLLVKIHVDAPPVLATPDVDLPTINDSHLYSGERFPVFGTASGASAPKKRRSDIRPDSIMR
jgi:hypothetical protein